MTTSLVRFGLPCNTNPYVEKRDSRLAISCSWCQRVLVKGTGPISHSICRSCLKKHFPEVA